MTMKEFTKYCFWLAGAALIAFVIFGVVGNIMHTASDAARVAHKEFDPSALLRKYEWFKDAAATLDARNADIKVYERRIAALKDDYKGQSRSQWSREDRESYNQWQSEVAGVKASFNQLAGEYNAQMAKFNWRFANAGGLPEGATQPLPREYKPYIND